MKADVNQTDPVSVARNCLASGDLENAKRILSEAAIEKPHDHLIAAWYARVIGQMEGATAGLQSIQNVLSRFPDSIDVWLLQMEMLLDAGFPELARDTGEQIRTKFPEDRRWVPLAVDALELMGDPSGAENLLSRLIQDQPDNQELQEMLQRLKPAADSMQRAVAALREARDEMITEPRIPMTDDFIRGFLSLFAGREGVHSVQCRQKGGWGYRPVRQSLDMAALKKHLAGDVTLGTYLVRRDNSSNLMVLDLDVAKSHAVRFEKDPLERRRLLKLLHEEAGRLLNLAGTIGLPLLSEFSGFKGFHFWAFSEAPVAARHWRALGQWMLSRLPAPHSELHWEIFPKQDSVESDGLGNLVKIPLGIHRRSNRRSWFINPATFQPWTDQGEALLRHTIMSRDLFQELLGRLTLEQTAESARERLAETLSTDTLTISQNTSGKTTLEISRTKSAEDQPPSTPLDLGVRMPIPSRFPPEIESLFSGCRIVWEIASNAMAGRTPSHAERHVLVYVMTALGEDGQVCLHQILNQTSDYHPDQVNRDIHAVCPNPMSCAKVRRNVPHLAGKEICACQFRLPTGAYASPLVYAGIIPTGGGVTNGCGSPGQSPPALAEAEEVIGPSAGIDRLMQEYSRLREEIGRMQAREKILRDRINRLFDNAGNDVIRTELGEYKRLIPCDDALEKTVESGNIPISGE